VVLGIRIRIQQAEEDPKELKWNEVQSEKQEVTALSVYNVLSFSSESKVS
jgi:hypothetical protein